MRTQHIIRGGARVAALATAFLLAAAVGNALAQTPSPAPATMGSSALSKGDQKIIADLAEANLAEIATAKLAQSKSQDAQVKQFAQQMVDDHGKALADVQQLAQTKGATLPTEPNRAHQKEADSLSKLSGAAFDKAYMQRAGVSDHSKVHTALRSMAGKAKDSDLKALIAKLQPTVDQHLNMAEKMAAGVKSTKAPPTVGGAMPPPAPQTR